MFSNEYPAQVTCTITFAYGKDDRPTPFEDTAVPLRRAIPQADIFGMTRCGRGLAFAQPEKIRAGGRMLFG